MGQSVMEQTLIHIGYHKTGSTWLQNEVFTRRSRTFYPLSTRDAGPSSLAESFIYDQEGYLLNSFDLNEAGIREAYKAILAKGGDPADRIPVMSHERLSGNPHSSGFDASILANRVQHIFPRGKVLIVLREQCAWLLSNYFQYLAIGGTKSLKEYLNKKYDGKRPGFSPNHLHFHHLIADYQSKFGRDSVLVLPFELFSVDKTLFFQKLGAFLGREIEVAPEVFEKMHNVKTDHFLNYKLRALNLFLLSSSVNDHSSFRNKYTRSMATRIRELADRFTSSDKNDELKEAMKREIRHWAEGRFEVSNRISSELLETDLEAFGYPTRVKAQ